MSYLDKGIDYDNRVDIFGNRAHNSLKQVLCPHCKIDRIDISDSKQQSYFCPTCKTEFNDLTVLTDLDYGINISPHKETASGDVDTFVTNKPYFTRRGPGSNMDLSGIQSIDQDNYNDEISINSFANMKNGFIDDDNDDNIIDKMDQRVFGDQPGIKKSFYIKDKKT